ncbi:MAG: ABC transporter ATP-binding protein [Candidatus Aminicenantes bacterium]|nr:ABC transporter ATP-binding protein [Candidatus Aminicenantes bacterium]
MTCMVEIKNLRKEYKGFTLEDISLDVPAGSIVGLIGPNGAGKTTTIRILMGMVKPKSGEIKIFGLDHRENLKEIKNRVGYVGEDHHFYGDKTVAWTGKFVSGFYREWNINLYQSLLTEFSISRTKKTKELSKGMKVKLSLAIAFGHNPELMVLDEPTAGLDPIIRRELLEILRTFPENGDKSVLISSHITDDIARIADYVAFLVEGKLALSEAKDELLARWKRIHYKKGVLGDSIIQTLTLRKDHMFGSSGVTDDFPGLREALSEGMAKEEIKVENVDLDEILISLVKGEAQ